MRDNVRDALNRALAEQLEAAALATSLVQAALRVLES